MKNISRKSFILFPFIFSIYPALSLMANNAAEMNLVDGLRALIFSLAFTLFIYLTLLFTLKDPIKVALITTLFLFLFFSYGHVNTLARNLIIANQPIGRHRILIPIYLLIFFGVTWLVVRTKKDLSLLPRLFSVMAIFLLLIPIFQIMTYIGNDYLARADQINIVDANNSVHLSSEQPRPDVYYILLDGYPRSDFIRQYFAGDISEFLEDLERRGFFVAHCSQSNYTDTRFAMASTLNMKYLDDGTGLSEVVYPGSTLDNMIRANTVQKNFSDLGYTIITFESGYKWLRWEETDLHLDPALERARREFMNVGINDFEKMFLDTTAAKIFIDIPFVLNYEQAKKLEEIINNPRASHRDRVMYALDKFSDIPDITPGPKFVYAHIIFPHPPFIVDAEGSDLQNSPADELSAYNDQIDYLNTTLLEIIDTLINNSDPDPIIIIQSDHGATIDHQAHGIDKSTRLGILNAYYLPDSSPRPNSNGGNISEGYQSNQLYSSITPVNTFRIIFDKYFGGDYGLLEDLSIVGRQSPFTTIECTPPG